MAPNVANRFALFAENQEARALEQKEVSRRDNPFANQIANDDTPWEEVKRGSTRGQSKGHGRTGGRKPTTLVIRRENNPPLVGTRSKQRDVSGSTQESTTTDDPHENWCGVCSYKLSDKAALQSHLKTAPGDHSNYCNLCKRVFKDRNGLSNHVDNAAGHDFFCNLCLSAFKDEWALECHYVNNIANGHQWNCLVCLQGFRSNIEKKRHLQTEKKHVACNTCHRIFRNQDERDAHWRETTKHKHCLAAGCDFDAPNTYTLEEHLKNDHFRCECCKLIMRSQTKLVQHHQICKFEVRCPDCGECCAGQGQLAMHMEVCARIQEDNTEAHQGRSTAATAGIVQLACYVCDHPMPSSTAIISHLENGRCASLSDPTLFTMCLGKNWYSPLYMDLDLHAQIRRNEIDLKETANWMEQGFLKPFTCHNQICDAPFARLSELVAHVESGNCVWEIERLRLDLLGADLVAMTKRRDSATGT